MEWQADSLPLKPQIKSDGSGFKPRSMQRLRVKNYYAKLWGHYTLMENGLESILLVRVCVSMFIQMFLPLSHTPSPKSDLKQQQKQLGLLNC